MNKKDAINQLKIIKRNEIIKSKDDFNPDKYDSLSFAINHLESNEWKQVSDQLPSACIKVLVCTSRPEFHICKRLHDEKGVYGWYDKNTNEVKNVTKWKNIG